MGHLRAFSEHLPQDRLVPTGVGDEPFQLLILRSELLEPPKLRHAEPMALPPSLVEHLRADP